MSTSSTHFSPDDKRAHHDVSQGSNSHTAAQAAATGNTTKADGIPPLNEANSDISGSADHFSDRFFACLSEPRTIQYFKFIFESQKEIITKQAESIKTLESNLKDTETELNNLKAVTDVKIDKVNRETQAKINELMIELNDIRQYSRRNSLRISNPNWIENNINENTNGMVLELAWQLGVNLSEWEIDRSHRVGKHHAGRQRPILVKFVGYGPRRALYEAGLKLKKDRSPPPYLRNVYINEDLTAETSALFYEARRYKRDTKIDAAITRDGRVLVRVHAGSAFTEVKSKESLENIIPRGSYSEATTGQLAPIANVNGQRPHSRPQPNHTNHTQVPNHPRTINERLLQLAQTPAAASNQGHPSTGVVEQNQRSRANSLCPSAPEFIPISQTGGDLNETTGTDMTTNSSLILAPKRTSTPTDTEAKMNSELNDTEYY